MSYLVPIVLAERKPSLAIFIEINLGAQISPTTTTVQRRLSDKTGDCQTKPAAIRRNGDCQTNAVRQTVRQIEDKL
jgi:hypothetical protein